MSSAGSEHVTEEHSRELFHAIGFSESSSEPPAEEWSSLIFEVGEKNPKKLLFAEELYSPGSGEICTKYIAQSDSSVFRHPYYKYPSLHDPGIYKALHLPEEKIVYPDDGQERYLAVCEEMGLCPVRIFHRNLREKEIILKYYGVNPVGVRAMALALQYNRYVKVLDLTDNFLTDDACFHLGEMLVENYCLSELNLSGCRIGPSGILRLCAGLLVNRTLIKLNLEKNKLGDEGVEIIANSIFQGIHIKQLNLSFNDLGEIGTLALATAFETNNKFTHLDLSRNKLFPEATRKLLRRLSENDEIEELKLAWNALYGPIIGIGISRVLTAPNIKHIDLSNNRLAGRAITSITRVLPKAKNLVTLNLSNNPMTPADAITIVEKLQMQTVKLKNLLLDDVLVNGPFMELRAKVLKEKFRKNCVITHGTALSKFIPKGADMRRLLLRRADYVARHPKKHKAPPFDICIWALIQVKQENWTVMTYKEFLYCMRRYGCTLDLVNDFDLINRIVDTFLAFKTKNDKGIDMLLLVDYMSRLWPERQLPPTPPPEPEPEPELTKKKGKGKVRFK